MKIISCHIENFGTLSAADYTFGDGCNTLFENNGAGKSTLAAFIKSMLYGIVRTGERNSLGNNDYGRYLPWQSVGGVFGGWMEFECLRGRFRVERQFAATEKKDVFRLTDLSTNQPSKAFGRDIGGELFGIDAASFERCTFISQKNISDEKLTENLRTRLTAVLESGDDSEGYENAVAWLNDRRREYKHKKAGSGKTEELYQLLRSLDGEIAECEAAAERMNHAETEAVRIQSLLKEYETEEKEARARVAKAADDKTAFEVYESYVNQKRKAGRAAAEEKAAREFFPAEIPSELQTDRCLEQLHEAYGAKSADRSRELVDYRKKQADLRAFFKTETIPDAKAIAEYREKLAQAESLTARARATAMSPSEMRRLDDLGARFSGAGALNIPTDTETARFRDSTAQIKQSESTQKSKAEKLGALNEEISEAENLKSEKVKGASLFVRLAILLGASGAILALLSFVFLVNKNYVVTIAFAGVGLFMLFTAAFCYFKYCIEKSSLHNDNNGVELKRSKAKELEIEIDGLHEKIRELSEFTEDFIAKYLSGYEKNSDAQSNLTRLYIDADEYGRLKERFEKSAAEEAEFKRNAEVLFTQTERFVTETAYISTDKSKLRAALDDISEKSLKLAEITAQSDALLAANERESEKYNRFMVAADKFFGQFGFPINTGLAEKSELVSDIKKALQRYKAAKSAAEVEFAELTALCERKGIDPNAEPPKAPDEAEAVEYMTKAEKARQKADAARARLAELTTTAANESKKADRLPVLLTRRDETAEEYANAERQAELIDKTLDYLKTAKDNLSNRYISKMEMGFRECAEEFSTELSDKFAVDADGRIKIEKYGTRRKAECFSTGSRGIIEFCMRMSLAKALYGGDDENAEREAPIILLDDPFVSADADNMAAAADVVRSIAQEWQWQVIYFTCHESRKI